MLNIEELKFDEKGLIPAIVVDTETKQVLTLAYMNAESLKISMEEGRTCFFSRSRQELWRKGETSGNVQHIVSITADCDADALVVVSYINNRCMLQGRKDAPKEGSYTSYLFEKGRDKVLKKVGEESTEVIIAAKDDDRANTIYELGDLMYHAMVLMLDMSITLDDIKAEMASRHVIDHKVKQEKMK